MNNNTADWLVDWLVGRAIGLSVDRSVGCLCGWVRSENNSCRSALLDFCSPLQWEGQCTRKPESRVL